MNPQLQDSFCVFSFPACGSLFQPVLQPYQGKSEPVIEMLAVSNSTTHALGWKGLLQIRTALKQLIEVCSMAGCPGVLCCFPCSILSKQQAMAILLTFTVFVLSGPFGTSPIAWEQERYLFPCCWTTVCRGASLPGEQEPVLVLCHP